jgi:hypothetical protein
MKRNRLIVTLLFGLLFAAGLVAAYLQQEPEGVARAACAERGVGAGGLALLGYHNTGWPIAQRASIEFQVQGAKPPKKIKVELYRWTYFLPWRVENIREEN